MFPLFNTCYVHINDIFKNDTAMPLGNCFNIIVALVYAFFEIAEEGETSIVACIHGWISQ